MISVDTNIVVRLLTGDDKAQYRKARALFEKHDVFIANTVVLQCEWVLRYAYEFSPADICDAFNRLFGLPNVRLENPIVTSQAIEWHTKGLDFADALHLAQSQDIDQFFTFDAKLIRQAKQLSRCAVLKP